MLALLATLGQQIGSEAHARKIAKALFKVAEMPSHAGRGMLPFSCRLSKPENSFIPVRLVDKKYLELYRQGERLFHYNLRHQHLPIGGITLILLLLVSQNPEITKKWILRTDALHHAPPISNGCSSSRRLPMFQSYRFSLSILFPHHLIIGVTIADIGQEIPSR